MCFFLFCCRCLSCFWCFLVAFLGQQAPDLAEDSEGLVGQVRHLAGLARQGHCAVRLREQHQLALVLLLRVREAAHGLHVAEHTIEDASGQALYLYVYIYIYIYIYILNGIYFPRPSPGVPPIGPFQTAQMAAESALGRRGQHATGVRMLHHVRAQRGSCRTMPLHRATSACTGKET